MNLPPEPDNPDLIERMRAGMGRDRRAISSALLRYQGFGGMPADKDAASNWLGRRALVPSQERIFVTPGAHPALLGIFNVLAKPGDTVLSEEFTYPGIRAIAAQLGSIWSDCRWIDDGIDAGCAQRRLRDVRAEGDLSQPHPAEPDHADDPATRGGARSPRSRGASRLPIVEDDAYGFIPAHGPPPFAALAPELTWHVAGLAKCIGAGCAPPMSSCPMRGGLALRGGAARRHASWRRRSPARW